MGKIPGLHGGHKPNDHERRWREAWYHKHPGWTHKAWAKAKREKRLKRREERLAKRRQRKI